MHGGMELKNAEGKVVQLFLNTQNLLSLLDRYFCLRCTVIKGYSVCVLVCYCFLLLEKPSGSFKYLAIWALSRATRFRSSSIVWRNPQKCNSDKNPKRGPEEQVQTAHLQMFFEQSVSLGHKENVTNHTLSQPFGLSIDVSTSLSNVWTKRLIREEWKAQLNC